MTQLIYDCNPSEKCKYLLWIIHTSAPFLSAALAITLQHKIIIIKKLYSTSKQYKYFRDLNKHREYEHMLLSVVDFSEEKTFQLQAT